MGAVGRHDPEPVRQDGDRHRRRRAQLSLTQPVRRIRGLRARLVRLEKIVCSGELGETDPRGGHASNALRYTLAGSVS
jgi:hypothetical protein